MNLKRNDKIILIVGVVILIIAGAGIALYNTPSEDTFSDTNDTDEMDYLYTWLQRSGSEFIESPMVNEDTPFEKEYTITSPSGSVLTQIIVNIDWVDDNTYGLIRTKGQDTLTIEVTLDGRTLDEMSVMEDNLTFPFNINSMPIDGAVNASSPSGASSRLISQYDRMNEADINVMLSIETGEPWWRFLFNRDNGNSVDISVDYTYYMFELTQVDDGDDMKTSGNDDVVVSGHALGEFYVNLGYGRGMI